MQLLLCLTCEEEQDCVLVDMSTESELLMLAVSECTFES